MDFVEYLKRCYITLDLLELREVTHHYYSLVGKNDALMFSPSRHDSTPRASASRLHDAAEPAIPLREQRHIAPPHRELSARRATLRITRS
jgi:hypothetical protein